MPPSKKQAKKPKKVVKETKACRICLDETDDCISFEVDSDWCIKFFYCFGITILDNLGPRVLCTKCSKKLKNFFAFKKLALSTDELWNNIPLDKVKEDETEKLAAVELIDETVIKEEIHVEDSYINDHDFPGPHFGDEAASDDNILVIVKEQDTKDIKEDIPKVELPVTFEVKEEIAPVDPKELKGLSEKEFAKKYFRVHKNKKSPVFDCLKCGRTLKRRTTLAAHVQKCYKSLVLKVKKETREKSPICTPDIFDCGLCDFNSPEENSTVTHVKQQHCLVQDLNCKLCEYTGRDMADVVTHRYEHIPVKFRGKYRCPVCDKIRLNGLSLQFHYRTLHLGKKAGGWCNICNKQFTGYIYFRNHLRWHQNAKYICDHCGAKFLFRNLIEAHIKEHMNIRLYICDTCGKSFKRNNALTCHVRAHHTKTERVPCNHCGKTFKDSFNLRLHMKKVTQADSYICHICSKGFPTLGRLKKHKIWHSEERPYACTKCDAKYKVKEQLQIHMRKHTGDFPFKCEYCDRHFATMKQLKVHLSVHTGIRSVRCPYCERTFHGKKLMLEHCRLKHEMMAKVTDITVPVGR